MKEEVVVLYPAPGIGHLVSMVELAKHLLLRHQHANTTTTTTTTTKFSIIILLASGSHLDSSATASYIHRTSLTDPSISFRRFPALAASSSPSSTARSGAAIIFEFIRLNAANVLHALQEISVTHTVRALVIDLFCTSALPIARDLRIPVYYFFTSGAAVLGCFFYFPTVDKLIKSNMSFKDLTSTYLRFPGLPPIPAPHAPEPLLDRDDPAFADFIYFCENLPNSDGIIVNTFNDLEPISVKTIATGACVPPNSITPPIYNIGPLVAASRSVVESVVNQAEARDDRLMSWLDSQPRQSVVYLCFGSRGSFSPAQIKEMANGLESSGQRFLWVIKSKSGTQDVHLLLPDGFLERTEGRGVVTTTWVPQVEVLGHESVGGFVTHCGWNSVLEAVVAGVPMVAWPLYAEQHVNKAVLVENMKMAIPLEVREGDGGFVSATELAKRVRELMESEVGRGLRERSRKMKEMAIAAWGESGSSTTALAKLVGLWKKD